MAFALKLKEIFSILIMLSTSMFFLYSEGDLQGQSMVRALKCFDNKLIYVGCEDAYRLTPSGNINIPQEGVDVFCSAPCLTETQLVLNCIDNILSNFIFYNKATVQQMRYALSAGCSYSWQKGNFNLEKYIGGEANNAPNLAIVNKSYLFIPAAAAAAAYLM